MGSNSFLSKYIQKCKFENDTREATLFKQVYSQTQLKNMVQGKELLNIK